MMSELAAIKLFIFVNLRLLLSDNELKRFHHNLDNHQINALLIEGSDRGRINNIPRIIIDQDMCEL